jgi:hypothetical protein
VSGWNYCRDGGLLVSSRTPIPDDQGEFYGTSRLDLVPCSHLVCSSCGEVVRSVANRQVPGGTLPSDLYDVSNWRRSDLLTTTDLPARAYACRCSFMNVVSDTLIASLASGAPLGWGCAGHPTVRGAFVLDGVSVEQGPALDAAVVAALDGRPPGALDAPWATHGAIWVLRLWGRLRGNPLQDAVGDAVAGALTSESVGARSEALTFFLQNPMAPGSDALIEAAREHTELFVGVAAPDAPDGETLEFQLLRILGRRLEAAVQGAVELDGGALTLLRLASMSPGMAGATLPALSAVDTAWVLENRFAIARTGKANALAVSLWVGINAEPHEEETDALLLAEGLLDEGDI